MQSKTLPSTGFSISLPVPEDQQLKFSLIEKVKSLENYFTVIEELDIEKEKEKKIKDLDSICLDLMKKKNDLKLENLLKKLESAKEKSLQLKSNTLDKTKTKEYELRQVLTTHQDLVLENEKEKSRIENIYSALKKKIASLDKETSSLLNQIQQSEKKINFWKNNLRKNEENHHLNFGNARKEYISVQERLNKEHENSLKVLSAIDEAKS